MVTIRTNKGTYTGHTVDTVVRRVFGRRASVHWSADRNTPEAGLIVEPAATGGWLVLATLRNVEERLWYTTVGFGDNPAPRGPWSDPAEARYVISRWLDRQGEQAGTTVAAHTLRVHAYRTREQARRGDISDEPGRDGLVSIQGIEDFLGEGR